MTDTVYIQGLKVEAIIGVHGWERETRQTLTFDVELTCDFSASAASDDVADAVDYGEVARAITRLVQQERSHLLEALAEKIATLILHNFAVRALRLRISKAGAITNATDVGIVIYRQK